MSYSFMFDVNFGIDTINKCELIMLRNNCHIKKLKLLHFSSTNFHIFRLRMNSIWSSRCWVPPPKITGLGLTGDQDTRNRSNYYDCGTNMDNIPNWLYSMTVLLIHPWQILENLKIIIIFSQIINNIICTGLRSCKATSSPTMLQSPW